MVHISALVSLLPVALAQTLPVKGVFHSEMGGIFGIGDRIPYVNFTDDIFFLFGGGSESPFRKSPKAGPQLKNGGSGPYKAGFTTDPTLPEHIIYAPKTPPVNVKLPVIVWGNWACFNAGEMFSVFLTEIASYGYLILANGKPGRDFLNFSTKTDPPNLSTINLWGPFGYAINETTKVQMLTDSIDWVTKGGAAKYGNIDTAHIAAAGHACGGLEAYATSYHDSRVKLTVLFNSGVILHNTTSLLKELKAPVGYFLGGPFDIAYPNGERDYLLLPTGLPAMMASLDTGHLGTYWLDGGGKFGKAAVAFFEWQFRGDEQAKLKFTDPNSEGSLVKDKWNVTYKNF